MEAQFYYNDDSIRDYHDGSQNIIKIVWENGCEEYYRDGVLHRDGGLPALVHSDGSREYFINGKRRTRSNGAAIEWISGEIVYEEDEAVTPPEGE